MLIKLILENYIPLLSTNITKVELDTTEMINLFVSSNGSGKELSNSSPIKIPGGWTTMGEIKVGMLVTAADGTTTKVTGVYPQGVKDMYRFHFSDGRYVDAGLEHLWKVYYNDYWRIANTQEIIELSDNGITVFIPLCLSEDTPSVELPIEPRKLGITIAKYVESGVDENIPSIYLNASHQQRLELLRGVLDAVGFISYNGSIVVNVKTSKLVSDLQYLVRSLGGVATYLPPTLINSTFGHLVIGHPTPAVLFKLECKKELFGLEAPVYPDLKLRITHIEKRPPEEASCISVEHPDRLYVTKDFIVTHNTSILKEANQLPPENGNYKLGRKYTESYYNGKTYVLDSYTGVGNGHSFKTIDDTGDVIEHNPNGTYTVQKDLVESHFGLDSKLVKVLNGIKMADRLSVMSASARKDLLMQVYPNDTEYALRVFNKLRIERNELKAAIKNQISRYTEESRKLKEVDEIGLEELERRIKTMEGELKQCLLLRGGYTNVNLDPALNQKINKFNLLTDQLTIDRVTGFFLTQRELENKIELLKNVSDYHRDQAKHITIVINENKSGLDGLDEFLKDPELFKIQAEQVEEDYQRTAKEVEQLEKHFNTLPIFNDLNNGFDGLPDIVNQLSAYLGRITVSSTTELTGRQYKTYLEQLETLTSKIKDLQSKEEEYSHKLKHYEQADLIECPDCESNFKVGITKEEIERTRSFRDALSGNITNLLKSKTELEALIENDADWFLSMNQLYSFVRENNHVKVLPELLKAFNIGRELSNNLQNALRNYSEYEKLTKQLNVIKHQRDVIQARLSVYERNNLFDVAGYLNKLEEELVKEHSSIRKTETELDKLRSQLRVITNYDAKLMELTTLKEEIFLGLEEDFKHQMKAVLDTKITELTVNKEACLGSIIKSRSLSSVVESINEDLERLKKRLTAVEILINGLCPNRGLIGKMMTDFIETIVGNMNAVLKQIWETTLYVKPCNKDNGELTYKFPVVTGDFNPTPDVSECSGGESDILDWVFRFVLLDYIKYPFPLIMDEVGPFLDEIKRGRFFNYIKEYTERKDARQLFLVSHYFIQYAIFKNANIIGLRYDGLTVPGEINQNTIVE